MKSLIFVLVLLAATAFGQTVVQTIDAPDTNISGLAYGAGSLWAVDGVTNYLYQLDPSSGAIQGSWYIPTPGYYPTGLGFTSNQVYVALTSGYVNYYSTAGGYLGSFSALC